MIFFDRYDAGQQLANRLSDYADGNAIIFALPKGGAIVADEVAKRLHLPMELLLVKKIGHPDQKELGIVAITESGYEVIDEKANRLVQTTWYINEVINAKEKLLHIREMYSGNRSPVTAQGRTAIIIDDGIATGLTMRAAIYEINKQHPKHVIIATPVVSQQIDNEIRQEVDQVISLIHPPYIFSLSDYYEFFPEVTENEIINIGKIQHTPLTQHHLHRIF